MVEESPEVDLATAVDVAIRDLRDIQFLRDLADIRMRAQECRMMLRRAFESDGAA